MAEILVLDDDRQFCGMLAEHLQRAGHGVSAAHTLAEGRQKAGCYSYDVVFLDIQLPDGSGLDVIAEFGVGIFPPEIIIITGSDDAKSAELAIRCGAWDFVHKRLPIQALMLSLSRALRYRESRQAVAARVALYTPELVGHSPSFRASLNTAAQAAGSEVNVLVTGETGTGKELFAKAIHENSLRSKGPFIVVDCTALPENLIGSVLFGHEKGAFTGADHKSDGLISQAHGGTLFLDEIGDMPLEIQKAFLRVLQERRYRPVGAKHEVTSDFRLVAATHRDMDRLAEEGTFRRDLLYRLRMLTVSLPPLRERMDDIPLLARHFVSRECSFRGGELKGMSEDFSEALHAYKWPGNVRELANAVAGAVAKAGADPVLFSKHLPTQIRVNLANAGFLGAESPGKLPGEFPIPGNAPGDIAPIKEMRDFFEKDYLAALIRRVGTDIQAACQISGLSRPHFYTLLKKHDLKLR